MTIVINLYPIKNTYEQVNDQFPLLYKPYLDIHQFFSLLILMHLVNF